MTPPQAEPLDSTDHPMADGREDSMKDLMMTFWKDESGQDMAEYALLLVLIAVVVTVAVIAFRGAIINAFNDATDQLNNPG
jgi:pilus assembly protein Flp/PilA